MAMPKSSANNHSEDMNGHDEHDGGLTMASSVEEAQTIYAAAVASLRHCDDEVNNERQKATTHDESYLMARRFFQSF